jgi:hypothetical protein
MALFRMSTRLTFRSRTVEITADWSVEAAVGEPEGLADPCLAAELATYRTPGELADLHAMLAQYPDEETAEIRAILDGQAERRLFAGRRPAHLGGGPLG